MGKLFWFFVLFIIGYTDSFGQNESLFFYNKVIEQLERIDALDGSIDGKLLIADIENQTKLKQLYLFALPSVTQKIYSSNHSEIRKAQQYQVLLTNLERVSLENIVYSSVFQRKLQVIQQFQKLFVAAVPISLRSNSGLALELMPFFLDKNWAKSFLVEIAQNQPAQVLSKFDIIQSASFAALLLEQIASVAPFKVQNYLYSNNPISRMVKSSKNPVLQTIQSITRELGTTSRAFILLDEIHYQKLTPKAAHLISGSDSLFFKHLIGLINKPNLLGRHSVEEALKNIGLRKVREINDLHDENDLVRFAPVKNLTAQELYVIMVYAEDEIFTSSFIGLFSRMMVKMTEKSAYEFLFHLDFMRFRTFMKMCAGYNSLSTFTKKMTPMERDLLFKKMAEGLEKSNDQFEGAMALADFYAALKLKEDQLKLEKILMTYKSSIEFSNPEGYQLYSLLAQVMHLEKPSFAFNFDQATYFNPDLFFTKNKNIQQHFFFDDPDGKASYQPFLAKFRNANWKITDYKSYIAISSVKGREVVIYANKPDREYEGQDAIAALFAKQNRFPDLVVHRGHSYFVNTAIESLTPSVSLVFLGSCGGYNQMTTVLQNAPAAQVIASKQIGTLNVNNTLIWVLNENLRIGKKESWDTIWKRVEQLLDSDPVALNRFKEYIPPNKNLGLIFLQAIQNI